jgi:crotonobetainyl-CoA:carnitine CoA-transferase CaiB-like acyl-CoA transferase
MRPLDGMLVLDAGRMLPAAVLARMLIELGARLIKIEDPDLGDPLRGAPPLIDGIGAGFRDFYRGAESICLDLRAEREAARLRKLARHADVLVESFRPGNLESWGLGPDRLKAVNPALVLCRLSGFGSRGPNASRVGHDLNFVALSGLLACLSGDAPPRVQLADIGAGVLACSAVLGALLSRARGGGGALLEQPLSSGPLPLLVWSLADAAAGGGGLNAPGQLLTGGCAAYRVYRCADGGRLALGALEPKFWTGFVEMLGLRELAGQGLETGDVGRDTARRVQQALARQPREHWLSLAEPRGLPLTAVHDVEAAARDAALQDARLLEGRTCAALLPSLGRRPRGDAPSLGRDTARITREFALDAG